jgi:hypothetical protein
MRTSPAWRGVGNVGLAVATMCPGPSPDGPGHSRFPPSGSPPGFPPSH